MNKKHSNRRLARPLATLAAMLVLGIVTTASSIPPGAPGTLDPSLDIDGVRVRNIGDGGATALDLVVLPDRRVLVATAGLATTSSNVSFTTWALVQFNADGSDDASFDGDGLRVFGQNVIGPGTPSGGIAAVLRQADGKIVVTGRYADPNSAVVARLNADGSNDASFSGDAVATFTNDFLGIPSNLAPLAVDVAQQADGKLVVAGLIDNGSNNLRAYFLLRLNIDGTLDTTYSAGDTNGPDGVFTSAEGSANDLPALVLRLQGGRAVLMSARGSPDTVRFLRHGSDGRLDTTFGTGGSFEFANPNSGGGIGRFDFTVLADNRLLFTSNVLKLGRLTADGALDASFGGDGVIFRGGGANELNQRDLTSALGNGFLPRRLAVQPDGRIVLEGGDGTVVQTARFLADGTPDLAFGDDRVDLGAAEAGFNLDGTTAGVALDSLGRVVTAAYISTNFRSSLVLLRQLGLAGADADTRPEAFNLVDQVDVPQGSERISNIITVAGLADGGVALIRVDGGQYSIGCTGAFTDAMEKVQNGATVCVRHTAAATPATRTTTSLRLSAGADEVSENFISVTAGGSCAAGAIPATLDAGTDGDGGFDDDGLRARNLDTDDGHTLSLLLTRDDRILVATGTRSDPSSPGSSDSVMAQFTVGGDDDIGFGGGDGLASFDRHGPFDPGEEFIAAARQPDGKTVATVVLGDGTNSVGLVRVNADGSPDTSFSADGVTLIERSQINPDARGRAVAVQADGKLLLAGNFNSGGSRGYFIARFNRDGSLDDGGAADATPGEGFSVGDGFGIDGVFVDTTGRAATLQTGVLALRLQGSRIILMGRNDADSKSLDFFGFTPAGGRDNAFGSNGVTTVLYPGGNFCERPDFVVQPADQKLLFTSSCITLGRLNANGTLDTGFAGDGIVFRDGNAANDREATTDLSNFLFAPRRLALQADGKIVLAGATRFGGTQNLARFFPDGLPDTGFGDDRIEVAFGAGFRNNTGLAVDSLGRVVFADTEATATPVNLVVGALCGGASVDTRPDAFVLTDQTGVPQNSVRTSDPITINGLAAGVPALVRVENGSYSIGCGADASYTDAMEKISNGQALCLRHTSAGAPAASVDTTLRISAGPDEFSDVFTSTTGTPNQLPLANPDTFTTTEGGTLNGSSVLANDSDADGDALTAELVSPPGNGSVTLRPDGTFTYVHNGSETSSDSFSYRAFDGTDRSSTASVSLSVTRVNDVPVARADMLTVAEGGTAAVLVGGATSVLANDSDEPGEEDSLRAELVSGPANGTLTLNPGGTFSYVHNGSETAGDSFSYRVFDGTDRSNTATVSIVVTLVNETPVAINDAVSVNENAGATLIAVLGNDTDPDGDGLTITTVGPASRGGLVQIVTNGANLQYTPAAEVDGVETFTYTVSDGNGGTDTATVTVTIANTDPPPGPGGTIQFSAPGFSARENAGSVAITITRTGGTAGAASARFTTADGSARAGADYSAVSIEVRYADGEGGSKTVNVPITNDTLAEANETVLLRLSEPVVAESQRGAKAVGVPATATLTILDDDGAAPPVVVDATAERGGGGSFGGGASLLLALAALLRHRRWLLGLALLPGLAGAQDWYGGLRGGYAHSSGDNGDITTTLRARGHAVTADLDSNEASYGAYLGRRLWRNGSLELGYDFLGHYRATASGTTTDPRGLARDLALSLPTGGDAYGVRLRWHIPLRHHWELNARLGGFYWRSEAEADVGAIHFEDTDDGVGIETELGLGYRLSPDWQLSAHWRLVRPDGDSVIQVYGLNLEYGW